MTRTLKELVPREAFREAVANALVHRTWDVDSRVRVSNFPIVSRSLPRVACRPVSLRQSTWQGAFPCLGTQFWPRCSSALAHREVRGGCLANSGVLS